MPTLRPQIVDRIRASEFGGNEMINLKLRPSPPWNVIKIEHVSLHFFRDTVPVLSSPCQLSRRERRVGQHIVAGAHTRGQTTRDQERYGRDPDIQSRHGMTTLPHGKEFPLGAAFSRSA